MTEITEFHIKALAEAAEPFITLQQDGAHDGTPSTRLLRDVLRWDYPHHPITWGKLVHLMNAVQSIACQKPYDTRQKAKRK